MNVKRRAEFTGLGAKFLRLAIYTVAIVIVFWRPIADLYHLSLSSDVYSHILVIPIISGGLVYVTRRRVFQKTGGTRNAAIIFSVLGIILLILSRGLSSSISSEVALQLAVLGFLALFWSGFAWMFGSRAFSAALFPLLLLVLMIPPPVFMLDHFIIWLQWGSANVTSWLFHATGTPAIRDGLVFSLPGMAIEITKECSGIRSTVALLITCLAAGYLFLDTPWARVLLLLAALPVLIIKNGIRIATLSLLALHVDRSFLTGSLHQDGGFVFFALGLLLLLPVLRGLQRIERDPPVFEHVSTQRS